MNLLSGTWGTGAAPALPAAFDGGPAAPIGRAPAAAELPPGATSLPAALLPLLPAAGAPPAAGPPPAPPVDLSEWHAAVAAQAASRANSAERQGVRRCTDETSERA